MIKYRNILVVIDPLHDTQAALSRAVFLAQKEDKAKIKALLTIYDFSYEMTSMLSGEEREAMRSGVIEERNIWLNEVIAATNTAGIEIETKVVWNNRLYESVIEEVLDFGHDLVVKATHPHPTLQSIIFTPNDWHILRKCPTPVLMVKEHDWPTEGKIIAAIHAGAEDDEHHKLNERIANEAKDLSKLLDANLHVVTAYPAAPVNIAIELPDFDPLKYNKNVMEFHKTALNKFVEEQFEQTITPHLEEGLPDDVIPEVANDIDAEIVILGTSGRSGFSAALIGNTAEHVIDQLDCDLLALKPQNFVSPFQK
ncbi:universal stress protein UspE [Agarivorans sp. Alg241-V36]|uniref:universal stress protein UspE n=1 Tax=Agarivorans sp. Alg241-V36 TaxID=2305992 RepID=UPI0013CF641A|nr:universal stress protein UspE [Agarivorans sp. Alg241-V36]